MSAVLEPTAFENDSDPIGIDDDDVDENQTYTYDQLSESAKETARNWFMEVDECADDIEEQFRETLTNAGIYPKTISFGLSYVQGDHVSFDGYIDANDFAVATNDRCDKDGRWDIEHHPDFVALRDLLKQIPKSVHDDLSIRIALRYHDAWCEPDIEFRDYYRDDDLTARELVAINGARHIIDNELYDAVRALISTVREWLKRDGYDEIDYRHSDDTIAEAIHANDYTFYRDGSRAD